MMAFPPQKADQFKFPPNLSLLVSSSNALHPKLSCNLLTSSQATLIVTPTPRLLVITFTKAASHRRESKLKQFLSR